MTLVEIFAIGGIISSNITGLIALFIARRANKIASNPTIFDDANNQYIKTMNKTTEKLELLQFHVGRLALQAESFNNNKANTPK